MILTAYNPDTTERTPAAKIVLYLRWFAACLAKKSPCGTGKSFIVPTG